MDVGFVYGLYCASQGFGSQTDIVSVRAVTLHGKELVVGDYSFLAVDVGEGEMNVRSPPGDLQVFNHSIGGIFSEAILHEAEEILYLPLLDLDGHG